MALLWRTGERCTDCAPSKPAGWTVGAGPSPTSPRAPDDDDASEWSPGGSQHSGLCRGLAEGTAPGVIRGDRGGTRRSADSSMNHNCSAKESLLIQNRRAGKRHLTPY